MAERDDPRKIDERDLNLHRKSIKRIKKQLFRKYSLEDYKFNSEAPEIILPSVSVIFHREYFTRELSLGGLKFKAKREEYDSIEFSVRHLNDDLFEVFTGVIWNGNRYSKNVTTCKFKELDDILFHFSDVGKTKNT